LVVAFIDIETTELEFKEREIINYLMNRNIPRFSHPFFAKIISIGIKKESEEPEIFHGNDEKQILADFWKFISEEKIDKIVTWNGYGFDIPFINIRSVINGIKKTKSINLNKWKMLESNHIDCMQFFSSIGEFQFVALEIACRLMDIPISQDRIRGEDIERLLKKSDWETIIKKNKEDLVMLEELYKKIQPFMI
jgi:DNA polymerase elongation subunit (family B)